ncbi:MAG: DUF1858 domain-containing protein [Candidatus Izemoplasmatales bacterium]
MKTIDLSQSVQSLVKNDPAVAEILAGLGFTEILKPGMLQTVGRIMTVKKGAALRGIDYQKVVAAFSERGYDVKEE